MENNQKYCKHCGELIDKDCVVCPKCGKQVENLSSINDKNIIINNLHLPVPVQQYLKAC